MKKPRRLPKKIRSIIAARARRMGYTFKSMAEAINTKKGGSPVTLQSVYGWVKGRCCPCPANAEALILALNIKDPVAEAIRFESSRIKA